MLQGELLSAADLGRLGALHVESIPGSLPALLGAGYAARLYRFFVDSPRELLLCERVGGRVEGACVVSLDPDTSFARITRATLPWLAASALARLPRSGLRRYLRGWLVERLRGGSADLPAPAIIYVFTSAPLRGSGLGARLLAQVEEALRARGLREVHVKTLAEPTNRAIAFYERQGYQRAGTVQEGGQEFVVLRRALGDSRPQA
ncbi:MAG: GNAT family N-acetyltransferase [Planctomycetota bacterium]